ncbi:ergot alkaloid biosynthesis protein [Paenibacillus sp. alder61]|uniref:Ergot alkaloid biosynthesis protein n=1 Tax=Paenibacillus faecis TaxID=862114 RepID=A0A5D0CRS8_9BACL|nr:MULTISPECIES: ergot alkaloid biosynthesis protein [Paenibacillus]MCA1293251.1 ergot alkaloid biosynthesis protein [Paenibacillus sp. alder61]TYA12320.1 ergot alkaloid biosynthesis protein [Paenibacillus faecis]
MPNESSTRFLLTGGQGKTSSRIAQLLHSQGYLVRRAGRSIPKPGDQQVGEHVPFDWFDDSNHDDLLQDVHAVYLVAPASLHPEEVMIPFIRRALDASVKRFVLLSSASIPEDGPIFGGVHRYLHDHAPEWAVLRPSYFMQNFTEPSHGHGYSLRHSGRIYTAAGDGKIGFVDADDIAAVGFHALTDKEPPNRELLITGPESLTYDDVAGVIRKVTGLDAKHIRVTPEQLTERHKASGLPESYAEYLAGMDVRIRLEGMEDRVTDTVLRITGREPRSLEQFISEHKTSFHLINQMVP